MVTWHVSVGIGSDRLRDSENITAAAQQDLLAGCASDGYHLFWICPLPRERDMDDGGEWAKKQTRQVITWPRHGRSWPPGKGINGRIWRRPNFTTMTADGGSRFFLVARCIRSSPYLDCRGAPSGFVICHFGDFCRGGQS